MTDLDTLTRIGRNQFDGVAPEDRFWAKVAKSDGCWLWMGARSRDGYGRFWMDGRLQPAHRVAWLFAHGEAMPDELNCCHRCDNPPCVRPDHLFAGTQSDNTLDSIAKGRADLSGLRTGVGVTHCPSGHPYDESNTYRHGGRRYCRTCQNKRRLERYHRQKASAA